MRVTRRHLWWVGAVVVAGVAIAWLMRPSPVDVDVAVAARGSLQVTLDEQGETRVRDHVELSAPVSGRLVERLVEAGDSVSAGQVVAVLYPAPLDARARAEAEAAIASAASLTREADTRVRQAVVTLDESRRALARARALAGAGALADRDLEQAVAGERLRREELVAARARARSAADDEQRARAALLGSTTADGTRGPIPMRARRAGRVLRLFEEHERVVPAGTPLAEIGDLRTLEVVVDVLSRDVADVRPGSRATVRTDASARPLPARVLRVEPAAFTKLSPLGVEEQRVKVIVALDSVPRGLGSAYEADVSIVLWEGEGILVPVGALVARGAGWGAFLVEGGKARWRELAVGRRGTAQAQVLAGVQAGDRVVVHPSEEVVDGVRVAPRAEGAGG